MSQTKALTPEQRSMRVLQAPEFSKDGQTIIVWLDSDPASITFELSIYEARALCTGLADALAKHANEQIAKLTEEGI